jgi:hypothetical protein
LSLCFSFGHSALAVVSVAPFDDRVSAAGVEDALSALAGTRVGADSLGRADRVVASRREADTAAALAGASESFVDPWVGERALADSAPWCYLVSELIDCSMSALSSDAEQFGGGVDGHVAVDGAAGEFERELPLTEFTSWG